MTPVMRSLSTPFFVACGSFGILALTQCGGGSDADGLAPSSISNMTFSCMVTGVTDSNVDIDDIYEMVTGTGSFYLTSQAEETDMWNGSGTYSYTKTGNNTARLILTYNKNSGTSSYPDTIAYGITINQLTFDSSTHASSGDGGAILSYVYASDQTNVVEIDCTFDITVISQS